MLHSMTACGTVLRSYATVFLFQVQCVLRVKRASGAGLKCISVPGPELNKCSFYGRLSDYTRDIIDLLLINCSNCF